MKLLIIEDEPPIAEHIKWMSESILQEELECCTIIHSLDAALNYLSEHQIDLLLLDLNLEGDNGFDVLKLSVSGSFHTIIISAYTEQAINAFQYGVLDFIPKPFDENRLKNAFDRYFNLLQKRELETRYLAVRENNDIQLIKISDIIYFKSAGNYIEAHLTNGDVKVIIKAMNKLEQILPARFLRTHKSYTVDSHQISAYQHKGGGVYNIQLKNGIRLPLSRLIYKKLKKKISL